jgi:MFS family permease
MLSGRVGDIYGHKRLFIIGVLLFSLASLTGGLAPSEIVLIVARVVQGLGAAMASATGLSILVAAFTEGKERCIHIHIHFSSNRRPDRSSSTLDSCKF